MTPEEMYPLVRERLCALVSGLDAAALATPVPATPDWTVRDVLGHVAGVCADVGSGNTEGAATPAWTAAQVACRRRLTVAQVCERWRVDGARFDAALAGSTDDDWYLTPVDAWHHEQDIRSALGIPGGQDAATLRFMADSSIGWLAAWRAKRLPDAEPVRLSATDQNAHWTLGTGTPRVEGRASCFELARMVLGRRSRDQIVAMEWSGDPHPHLDRLHVFLLPQSANEGPAANPSTSG